MVPSREKKSGTAAYALERVHKLAEAGKVMYAGRKVQRDIANLNYEFEDVCRCLRSLNACHFKESLRYVDSGVCFDVYRITCRGKGDTDDPLYVKLKISQDHIVILGSFHR